MNISNMFRYMCTVFRENAMPIINTQMLLRSCHLWAPWSVADSSLTLILCKTCSCKCFKTWWLQYC